MAIFVCRKCNKEIDSKKALIVRGNTFCPECKGLLSYFGKESAKVSSKHILDNFDSKFHTIGNKSLSGKRVLYENPQVNVLILECRDALKINPKNIEALFALAKLYRSIKEDKLMLESLGQILEIDKNHIEALRQLADFYLSKKDFEKAVDQLNKLAEIDGNNFMVFQNIGVVYYQQKNLSAALENFHKAYDMCDNAQLKEQIFSYILKVCDEMGIAPPVV